LSLFSSTELIKTQTCVFLDVTRTQLQQPVSLQQVITVEPDTALSRRTPVNNTGYMHAIQRTILNTCSENWPPV